jgi:DNA polymerase III epsilon subunit-like protein
MTELFILLSIIFGIIILFFIVIYKTIKNYPVHTEYETKSGKSENHKKPCIRTNAKEEISKFLNIKTKTKIIIYDIKTNGLNKNYSVLSCSAIKYEIDANTYKMTELERFNRYYYPVEKLEKSAIEKHRLTKEEITKRRDNANYPEYFIQDIGFFNFCQGISRFVAHNIDFDLKFIPFLNDKKKFCTMKINTDIVAIKLLDWKNEYKYPTLAETAMFYNVQFDENSLHDSMVDIEIIVKVFEKMLEKAKNNS